MPVRSIIAPARPNPFAGHNWTVVDCDFFHSSITLAPGVSTKDVNEALRNYDVVTVHSGFQATSTVIVPPGKRLIGRA